MKKRKMFSLIVFFLCGILAAGISQAEETFSCPPAGIPPVIDGRITETEWRNAVVVYGALDRQGLLEPRPVIFFLGYSAEKVFCGIKSAVPPAGRLVAQGKNDGKDILTDDVWEIWLHPVMRDEPDSTISYQLMGNSLGFRFNTKWDTGGMGWKPLDWNPDWEYKASVSDGWWTAEISIPLVEIGIRVENGPWQLKFNICRSFKNPTVYSSLAGASNFGDVKQMALFIPDREAPFVKLFRSDTASDKNINLTLEIVNASSNALSLRRIFDAKRADGKNIIEKREEIIEFQAGQGKSETFLKDTALRDEIGTEVLIASAETPNRIYFSHRMRFGESRKEAWGEQSVDSRLSVLYLPSFNNLEIAYDAGPLIADGNKPDSITVSVRAKDTGKEVSKAVLKDFDKLGEASTIFQLPPLKEGIYEVEASPVVGGKNYPAERASFEKKGKFEWEGNNLGISDEIIPPFTSIQVKGDSVNVILREMEMNGFGLWKQVKSRGQKILSGPMLMEVESGGKNLSWISGTSKLVDRNREKAVFESRSENDFFMLKTKSTIEYDGFMKIEMDMVPKSEKEIDRFSMVVPMPAEVAYLMHACNEIIRSSPAGNIPQGTGQVWENRLMPSYTKTKFVPYIWLGGEEKGICWMADDEKDWVVNPKKPSFEIIRQKDQVFLKIHFMNDRVVLSRDRKFVFALMATPVKPMPEGHRRWGFTWWHNTGMPENYIFFGNTLFYGAETFADPFPKDRDFSIFTGLKKTLEAGVIDEAVLNRFLAKYPRDNENDKRRRDGLLEAFNVMKKCASNQNNNIGVMQYMDPMHVNTGLPESDYFRGEWRVRPERSMYTNLGIPLYLVQPTTRSYQDFLLYYYDKTLRTGLVKILYYDEVGFSIYPSYNPAIGKGYINDQGERMGSRSLFELRDFFKRVALLYRKHGMYPMVIAHTTNQFIIPSLSFVNMIIDWEDKFDSPDTFLKRFPDDFIRAETMGLQNGSVSFTLGVSNNTTKYTSAQLQRSYWALNLLNGLRNWGIQNQPLVDFGYWADDCIFVPYWEKKSFVKASSEKIKISYYSRKDSAFIILVNYGEAGDFSVSVDLSAFGLPQDVKATDPETKKAIESSGQGKWDVTIPKHDYLILLLQKKNEIKK